eukprot:2963469-Rhodomonas_salina.2
MTIVFGPLPLCELLTWISNVWVVYPLVVPLIRSALRDHSRMPLVPSQYAIPSQTKLPFAESVDGVALYKESTESNVVLPSSPLIESSGAQST